MIVQPHPPWLTLALLRESSTGSGEEDDRERRGEMFASSTRGGVVKRKLTAAGRAVALAALLLPAAAGGETTVTFEETASLDGCHDQVNFVTVPMSEAQIRDGDDSNDRVPEDYTVRPIDPSGETTPLVISEIRCDKGTVGETVLSDVRTAFVSFQLTGPPEGSGHEPTLGEDCTGEPSLPPADDYLLFFSTSSKPLADWLRAGTHVEVYYVPEMEHDYRLPEPFGIADFFFKAPAPTKWAFTVGGPTEDEKGTASTQQGTPTCIPEERRWQDTKSADGRTWRVKLTSQAHDNYLAPADVWVHAGPGSEMEKIFGTSTARDNLVPVSGLIPTWVQEKTRTVIRP